MRELRRIARTSEPAHHQHHFEGRRGVRNAGRADQIETKETAMSNLPTNYEPPQHDDGWGDAADDAQSTVIRGAILKFADWRWTYGQEGTVLKEGTRLLATATRHGWVRWWGGKPDEYRMRRQGEQLPGREEKDADGNYILGDMNKGAWELGFDDQPKDPWQETRFVYLLGENAEAYTFSTSSWGGRGAVIDLGDQILRMRFAKRGAIPIVELHAAVMQTKFGKKSKPVFKVVDWRYPDGSELAAPASRPAISREPPKNADMDDAIPF
jgi:hypothetical protein